MNEKLLSSYRPHDKLRLFRSFAFFVGLLKDKVCKPSVLRGIHMLGFLTNLVDVVYTILRHITDRSLQDECCNLILDITSKALTNKDKLRELTRHLSVVSSH
jgi:hypothetical protein